MNNRTAINPTAERAPVSELNVNRYLRVPWKRVFRNMHVGQTIAVDRDPCGSAQNWNIKHGYQIWARKGRGRWLVTRTC